MSSLLRAVWKIMPLNTADRNAIRAAAEDGIQPTFVREALTFLLATKRIVLDFDACFGSVIATVCPLVVWGSRCLSLSFPQRSSERWCRRSQIFDR